MAVFIRQSKQDVETGRGQREKSFKVFFHGRIPIYRNPTYFVKTYVRAGEELLLRAERRNRRTGFKPKFNGPRLEWLLQFSPHKLTH